MLTGKDVLKDYEANIDLSSFSRKFTIKESSEMDKIINKMFINHGVSFDMCFLHTTTKRSSMDIADEIIKSDYVWVDHDQVVAFWKQSTKTLYY